MGALSLNGLYRERNYVRFFGLFKKLPLILKLAAHWNIPHVLSSFFTVMNSGFSSKNCRYPLSNFMKPAVITNSKIISDLCSASCVTTTYREDGRMGVNFLKSSFT